MCCHSQSPETQTALSYSKSIRLAAFLVDHKGCSINLKLGHPICGYMVSTVAGPVYEADSAVDLRALAAWCRENSDDNSYFGSWVDEKTGKLYIDVSDQFYSYDAAMQYARDNNQIAIWDVNNNCEIRTNG